MHNTDRAKKFYLTTPRLVGDAENRLEVLPPSLSQLTQLEVLTLSSNHVYQLPDEMVGLEKLKVSRVNLLVTLWALTVWLSRSTKRRCGGINLVGFDEPMRQEYFYGNTAACLRHHP